MKDRSFWKTLRDILLTSNDRKSHTLLWVQLTLILFIIGIFVLVLFVDESSREIFYVLLLSGLALILFVSVGLNATGNYGTAALLTVIATVIGPWGSILLDPAVFCGDFVPLIYLSLSIQLCAILLSVKPTIIIGIFQFCMLILCIVLNEQLWAINWPSLVSFIALTAGISIMASSLNRKQFEQIKMQKEQLQQNEIKLKEAALRDSLTGLYNRRYMASALNKEINRASRNQYCFGIIMVDIDNFKSINDTFGHACGDTILTLVAETLISNVRDFDMVCRYGGDEFVLMTPNSTLRDTLKIAESLRKIIEDTDFTVEGKTMQVLLSFGVTAYPEFGMCAEDLLRSADQALYAAKENGRNSVIAAALA